MEYFENIGDTAAVCGDDFDLAQTLCCGQFFRYEEQDGIFSVISGRRTIRVYQKGNIIHFAGTSHSVFQEYWRHFFDLDRDYGSIRRALSADPILSGAADFAPGIRLLNQDPWECLLCFILSQNNRIPMIMQGVKNIAERFGEPLPAGGYALPLPQTLSEVSEDDLRACKVGFRAPYILDAARAVSSGATDIYGTEGVPTDELRSRLTAIRGVGPKVADCVMLYSMGRREVFPTDVWIARIMRRLYLNEDADLKTIQNEARRLFGENAGYAQQYLFHFARTNKIL